MPSSADVRTAKYPTKLRRNYPRSRSGCLTCRQRKKKCDEVRPQCAGCQRNQLPCVWPSTVAAVAVAAVASSSSLQAAAKGRSDSSNSSSDVSNHENGEHNGSNIIDGSANSSSDIGSTARNRVDSDEATVAVFQRKNSWHDCLPMLSVWPGRDGLEGSSSNSSSGLGGGAGAKRGAGVMSTGASVQVSPLAESTTAGDENDSGWEDAGMDSDSMGAAGPGNRRTTEAGVAAAWSAALGVFSAAPLPVQFRRVAAMTPLSSAMLRRYIVSTAAALATTCGADNPFLAAVLPLAYTDDLVMHCVIALGGADLSSSSSSSSSSSGSSGSRSSGKDKRPMGPCSDNESAVAICRRAGASPSALHEATTRHYACVLRSLRAALRDLQPTDTARVLRTLLVLVLLAVFEGTSWNVLDGGVFAHLGASRQLIAWLRPELPGTRPTTTSARVATSASAAATATATTIPMAVANDERSMLGALLEVYAYLVLANRVTPDGTMDSRRVVGPDGSTADEDFVLDPSMLADQHYFGVLFAGMHDLFALIPPVSRLAGDAAAVASAAAGRPEAVHADAVVLRNRARAWQLPASCLAQAAGDQDRTWWRAIGEVYRHALLVYIETAELWAGSSCMGPADGEDEGEDEGERGGARKPITGVASLMEATIQRHIHAVGEATLGDDLVHSRFIPIILWPLMVIGSILASASQRAYLVDGLRNAPHVSWGGLRGADVLELLWRCRDAAVASAATTACQPADPWSLPVYYGPYGLARVMREYNINLCVF